MHSKRETGLLDSSRETLKKKKKRILLTNHILHYAFKFSLKSELHEFPYNLLQHDILSPRVYKYYNKKFIRII